ncbi:MAG: DHH family phosphoesterase [Candidatus Abawacabacteria bacterium]|nr:DHH family phosphoesterase [Candidatus Abawacabacteria bacterium]
MHFPPNELTKLKEAIQKASHILLIDPAGIDGDSIGSHLAWKMGLEQLGKRTTHFCISPLPNKNKFLPRSEEITDKLPEPQSVDVAILCDQGDVMHGLKERFDELKKQTTIINVDHHFSNKGIGHINIMVPEATSSTQVTYYLLRELGVNITAEIATCLLNGIYTDTGSFQHSNTSPEILELASVLLKRGANFKGIVHNNFHSMPISKLRIWGRVLQRIHVSEKQVTVSGVTQEDFQQTQSSPDALEGVVDFMTGIPQSKFSILLSERKDIVKGSLRTLRDDIDLSALAQLMNGGGHRKASGFSLPGTLKVEGDQLKVVPLV